MIVSVFRDSFLDCLPRGRRILPRRIPMHAAFPLPTVHVPILYAVDRSGEVEVGRDVGDIAVSISKLEVWFG